MAKKRSDEEIIEATYQRNELLPPVAGAKMNFKSWFINLLGVDKRVKQHHYEQLKVFMAGLGISDFEEPSRYAKALKTYFGE